MTHHLDACRLELAEAVASHQRVGVVIAADHPFDAFLDDKVRARRRLAIVRARLEVDVQRSSDTYSSVTVCHLP